ncbi:Hypothetical protein POVR2_LOCUS161 [uncultured virus]|nr:Hypothetical protein POVR2_LOCUS161 [uncultured virus]
MESSQPRASEPLSKLDDQIVIPVEVLAKILQRNDISAAISKCLSIVGYIHYPTVVEMDKFNEETWLADHVTYAEGCLGRPSEYELVYLAGISEEEIGHVKYSLSKTSQNGEFILKNKLCNGDRTGRIIEYSLRTYDNFYNDREPTNKMLRDLQDRLTSCKLDEAEICSWIVQLSHTISNWRWTGNTEVRFSDLTSLRDELVRLIDVLLHQRASSLAA